MRVNKNLKLAILKTYDTQADFAEAAGVAQSKVSEVIRGRRQLRQEEQQQWAHLLKVESREVFAA